MPGRDQDIDRLYQLPLSEFIAARDALAKGARGRGHDIRLLAKPSVAAWAVNQVYWHRRKTFEELAQATERLRAVHGQRLAGKTVDVAIGEAKHQRALDAAVAAAAELLIAAGAGASDSTLTAVRDTFQALLWTSFDGRLIKPLRPTGVEALAGLMGRAVARTRPAELIPFRRPAEVAEGPAAKSTSASRKREEAARRRAMAQLARQVRAARAEERKADTAVASVRHALERAQHDRRQLEADLERVMSQLDEQQRNLRDKTVRLQHATGERTRLEAELAARRNRPARDR